MSIYQVSFSIENVGKRQEDSKKRLKWIYQVVGTDGQSGQHEIEFTWSLLSGKQEVTLDGQNVMFNRKKGQSVFDENLTKMGEKPSLQLVCARKAPIKAHPDFQCYELLIDDKPFGTYPSLDGSRNNNANQSPEIMNPDSTINGDIMQTPNPFYDGPMSILDICYPGKYSSAPVQQMEMEEGMAFPEDHNGAVVVSDQQTSPFALADPLDVQQQQSSQPLVDLLA